MIEFLWVKPRKKNDIKCEKFFWISHKLYRKIEEKLSAPRNVFTFFIHLLIDFFTFNPQRLWDRIGLGICSQFFSIGFFGFLYQVAHMNSLAWVTLFRNIFITIL